MKDTLIKELQEFKTNLIAIDAQYATIKEDGFENKKHLDTLRAIEIILVNIQNRVDRFYTQEFQYNKELKALAEYLKPFSTFFVEILPGGYSMEECKLRVIEILDGIISELEKYDVPSDNDLKFDE